jgi:hypothetical protein
LERRRATLQRGIDRDNQDPVVATVTASQPTTRNLGNAHHASQNLTPAPGSDRSPRRDVRAERHAHSSTQAAPVSSAQALERPDQTPRSAHTPTTSSRRTSDHRATNRPHISLAMPERTESSSDHNTIPDITEPTYIPTPPTPTIDVTEPTYHPAPVTDDTYLNYNRMSAIERLEHSLTTRLAYPSTTRDTALIEREAKFTKRKRELDERETELNKRAKSVAEHEAIAVRKRAYAERTEVGLRMLQKHKTEMEVMARRQQSEMEKLMKKHHDEMKRL